MRPKSKPQVKLPSRINPGRPGARARPSAMDTAHKLSHSLERANKQHLRYFMLKSGISGIIWLLEISVNFQKYRVELLIPLCIPESTHYITLNIVLNIFFFKSVLNFLDLIYRLYFNISEPTLLTLPF